MEFFIVDFILLNTRSRLATNSQKVMELRINDSFLTSEGSVVRIGLDF